MRRPKLIVAVVALALAVPLAACGNGGDDSSSSGGTVTLQFSSYAWQDPTVKATKDIVAAWNSAHPNVQVKYVPVDPDSVHDKLVTQFAGGSAPDIIHDEAADIAGFVDQGYLADMSKMIPADLKNEVPKGIWDSVTFKDGGIYGAPTLLQSYVVFANKSLLDKAGVTVPTADNPWTWDQFQAAAKQLTTGGATGLGWGLKQPVATVLSMALNFNGTFIQGQGQSSTLTFGANERQVPQRIHDMIADKSLAPGTVGQSGSDVLPGFFGGKYAMIVGGNYASQQMVEQAPKDFQWVMLPMLKGDSQNQAADPQTLSIAAQSKHQQQAMDFIAYYDNTENLAKLAQGDWLIPAGDAAAKLVAQQTQGKNGWDAMSQMGKYLTVAPFESATPYPQWKTQIATPALQEYFGGKLTIDELGQKLTDGWKQVAGG
jgi:ABC-type glycerol-3-phosphate transport system substrate-binding protein